MPAREVVGGRGGPLGSQQVKVAVGSQMKGRARKARKAITLDKSVFVIALLLLTCISDQGKTKMLKHVWAASAIGTLCTSQEGLCCSIDALHSCLKTYNLEVWSILHEWDTCAALVEELEEVLAEEMSTDEDEEVAWEMAWYEAKRAVTVRQKVVEEEDEDGGKGEGESELEEEEDEPVISLGCWQSSP